MGLDSVGLGGGATDPDLLKALRQVRYGCFQRSGDPHNILQGGIPAAPLDA